MTPDQTPEELRELLGAYALNALDADERAEVDALLLTDPSARAELHELEHAAAWLGHASLRPPESAWETIAAEVQRDLAVESDVEQPTPLKPRRATRWLVAAAAAVVVVVAAVGGLAVIDRSSSPTPKSEFAAALRNDDARQATLRSADGTYAARAVVLPDRTGYLGEVRMPAAAPGRDLQLWSITPAGAVSAGLLRGDGAVHRFRVAGATTALAVTNEPRGGSATPTGIPLVSGDLPSA